MLHYIDIAPSHNTLTSRFAVQHAHTNCKERYTALHNTTKPMSNRMLLRIPLTTSTCLQVVISYYNFACNPLSLRFDLHGGRRHVFLSFLANRLAMVGMQFSLAKQVYFSIGLYSQSRIIIKNVTIFAKNFRSHFHK